MIGELLRRTSLPATAIDDVILGQCYPNGEAPAIGRVAALDAGLPDRGARAAARPPLRLRPAGDHARLHGGADRRRGPRARRWRREHEPGAEFYATDLRWGVKGGSVTLEDRLARPRVTAGGIHHRIAGGMIETAENLRRQYGIARAEQDELALRSHGLAIAAQQSGDVRG